MIRSNRINYLGLQSIEGAFKKSESFYVPYKIQVKRCLFLKINLRNVFLFSSMGPCITVKMKDDTFLYRGNLKTIEREISELVDCFVRINKRYLVNTKYIKSFSNKEIVMINGGILPLSAKYRGHFFEKMKKMK